MWGVRKPNPLYTLPRLTRAFKVYYGTRLDIFSINVGTIGFTKHLGVGYTGGVVSTLYSGLRYTCLASKRKGTWSIDLGLSHLIYRLIDTSQVVGF